jgi:hypothetical protein
LTGAGHPIAGTHVHRFCCGSVIGPTAARTD